MQTFPIVVTFALYGFVLLFAAYLASSSTHNKKDFAIGGRRSNAWLTALGAGSSDMSSWLLMAFPGFVFVFGLSKVWMPIALAVGAFLNWRLIATRLRIYTEVAQDSVTLPEFFANRFVASGSSLQIITSLIISLFFIFYSAAGFISGALLLENTFDISYNLSLGITSVVIVTYIVTGGFLAINWMDFFQGMLMFLSLLIVPIVAYYSINTDLGTLTSYLTTNNKLDIFANMNFLSYLALFAWGFGYFGQPHIQVRFMATRDIKDIPFARRVCMSWMILSLIGAILTALVGIFIFKDGLIKPETVFIELARQFFNPWLTGILLSAVLSAIMSTVSVQTLMTGSIVVTNIQALFKNNKILKRNNTLLSRIAVILISLIAILISINPKSSIMSVVGFAWAGLGASIGPVLLFSLYFKRLTSIAAIIGVIVGGLSVIGFEGYFHFIYNKPELTGISLLPGFILSSLSIYMISLNTKKPNKKTLANFDKMLLILNKQTNS